MSRLGFKSVVYHDETCLGELYVIPVTDQNFQFPNNDIRIHHISPPSERCLPLSILQTISSFSVRCKLESSSPTAVVVHGDEELHLVAMPSKKIKFPCFWCYSVPLGLYCSSLELLNLRCLAIVFDLDDTIIVASSMKSFNDRIEALQGCLARENDLLKITGMTAELKRYAEDRVLLKQYTENDCVTDNGKTFKVQMEEVPQSSDGHEKVLRPIIRLQENNIVLTRINPEIRDTSVLVRLRPAWEDLRSYLTAKGRKRFEVYVCTMAQRDYALEMRRLLDPEANLITSRQLQDRVVCIKSGGKKSLQNVFQDGMCYPKMAMVVDDRSKVWEDRDQPRVHVVPPFTPYYAPQAEMANVVPVLCVARNVACNTRGYFFREFDENLLPKISEISYEDDVTNLPPSLDVSNYLIFKDSSDPSAPTSEEIHDAKVNLRLHKKVKSYKKVLDKLKEAKKKVASLEARGEEREELEEAKVASLEAKITSLEAALKEREGRVASLEAALREKKKMKELVEEEERAFNELWEGLRSKSKRRDKIFKENARVGVAVTDGYLNIEAYKAAVINEYLNSDAFEIVLREYDKKRLMNVCSQLVKELREKGPQLDPTELLVLRPYFAWLARCEAEKENEAEVRAQRVRAEKEKS